jgi:hypothetical protein
MRGGTPDPSDDSVSFDVPLITYQMAHEMYDDTSTDFDVYIHLMQMSADADDDPTSQKVLFEAGQIALENLNSSNDD